MMQPIFIVDYFKALQRAFEISLVSDFLVYFIRSNSGGYVIESYYGVYSDEHLIMTIFKGEVQ